ncbi:MAG TPA: SDR family oxidoreductase [Myxococcales bacterium]|nr:SDR family oxidoreductase [Myxococcales bacterium]
MGTIAISGCATGIGAATRKRFEADGHRVIGIDLRDVEVVADLSTPEGRGRAIDETLQACGGRLDGTVLCAGLGGHIGENATVASVNYFGVAELLDGLFPALQRGEEPSAVVMCSNSAQLVPNAIDTPLVQAMLARDEPESRRVAEEECSGQLVYMLSKNAVGTDVRRRALAWGDAGVRINALAPGPIETPLLQGGLDTPGIGDAIREFKVPVGRWGRPEEIAEVVAFLMGPHGGFVHGSIWYVDGGADALTRSDRF